MLSLLCLGDSYTIGEQVLPDENFPAQWVRLLREQGVDIADATLVAKTGWTTDELQSGIAHAQLLPPYNMVTLLIGVNNQYRGRPLSEYKSQFSALLQQAIHFSLGGARTVAVLSIPDWGATPYAAGRDRAKITQEIDLYNTTAESICRENGVAFISITSGTREAASDSSLITGDGLHPSGKEYHRWALKLLDWYAGIAG